MTLKLTLPWTLALSKSKSKSKCVYIYSGNSTILVLDNRRWGADSTSTSFPPVPGAHSCGCPGQMFSAPICTVPRMAYVVINGNRLSKHGPLCFQILPRPGSHLGHRAIRRPHQIQHMSLRVGESPTRFVVLSSLHEVAKPSSLTTTQTSPTRVFPN